VKTESPIAQPQKRLVGNPPKHLVRWAINKWIGLSEYGTQFTSQWFKIENILIHIEQYRVTLINRCAKLIHGFAQPRWTDTLVRLKENGTVKESCCSYPLPESSYEPPAGCGATDEYADCWYQYWYPSVEMATDMEIPREWTRTKKLVRNGMQVYNTERTGGYNAQHPGLYTGEMRKVVQDHFSRGYRISYSYTAAKTHGIYIASDQTKWLVEISDTYGVRAKLLSTCAIDGSAPAELRDTLANMDYIPVPTRFDDSEGPDPSAITLMSSGTYAATCTVHGASLFDECGWAFSASGASVANVMIRSRTASNSKTYDYGTCLVISIAEDPETKKPKTATASTNSDGWIYGDRVCQLKYPLYTKYSLISYDAFKGQLTELPFSSVAPMYCWYEGESLKKVNIVWSPTVAWLPTGGTGTGHRTTRNYLSPIIDATVENKDFNGSYEAGDEEEEALCSGGEFINLANSDVTANPLGCWAQCSQRVTEQIVSASYLYEVIDVVVIPLQERQGVFHGRSEGETLQGDIKKHWALWMDKAVVGNLSVVGGTYSDTWRIIYDSPYIFCMPDYTGVPLDEWPCAYSDTKRLVDTTPYVEYTIVIASPVSPRLYYVPNFPGLGTFSTPAAASQALAAYQGYTYTRTEPYYGGGYGSPGDCPVCASYGVAQYHQGYGLYNGTEYALSSLVTAYNGVGQRAGTSSKKGKTGDELIADAVDDSSSTLTVAGLIDGVSILLDVSPADFTNHWAYFITPEAAGTQNMAAVVDQSKSGDILYTSNIEGTQLTLVGSYPVDDVNTVGMFLGNPELATP
jgi:hypothetical protein